MAWGKVANITGPVGPPGPTDMAALDERFVNVTGDEMTGALRSPGISGPSTGDTRLLLQPGGGETVLGANGGTPGSLTLRGIDEFGFGPSLLWRLGTADAASINVGPDNLFIQTRRTNTDVIIDSRRQFRFRLQGFNPVDCLTMDDASGAVFTRPVTLPGNAAQPLQAVPLQQLTTALGTPLDDRFVNITGDRMTGALRVNWTGNMTLAGDDNPFTIGSNSVPATDFNMAFGVNTIQARQGWAASAVVSPLNLNSLGGPVNLSNSAVRIGASVPERIQLVRSPGATWAQLAFYNDDGTTRSGFIGTANGTGVFVGSDAGPVGFMTAGSEWGRFDATAGHFMLAMTSASVNNPGFFYNAANQSINTIGGSDASIPNLICNKTALASAHPYIHFRNTNTTIGTITRNAATAAVMYNTTSDYRLKDDRGEITGALDRIQMLKPRRVHWIGTPDEAVVDGWFAHEVAIAVPEAVTGEKDAVTPEPADPENDPPGGQIQPQQLDQSALMPLVVAAVKELWAEVQALKGAA